MASMSTRYMFSKSMLNLEDRGWQLHMLFAMTQRFTCCTCLRHVAVLACNQAHVVLFTAFAGKSESDQSNYSYVLAAVCVLQAYTYT